MDSFYLDLSGIFGGSPPDVEERAKIFRKELELIDKKYSNFFKSLRSLLSNEDDSIFNHCKTYIGYNPVKFLFTDNVVPGHIQKECFDAFERIFEYRAL